MATTCLFVIVCLISRAFSLNNGLARSPPLGWRSWNAYWFNIDQQLMAAAVDGLLDKSRTVNGIPTSLAEIGYNDAGIDDGWQLCDSSGNYFHNDTSPNGWAVINTDLFPDLHGLVKYAHANNIKINFYFNNCHCAEQNKYPANEANDVRFLRLYDLDGVKLDGCGSSMNTSNWNRLINETGTKPILTEDGGNTNPPNSTNEKQCPMNMYNFVSGSGMKALFDQQTLLKQANGIEYTPNVNYPLVIDALQGIIPFVNGYPNGFLSYPGCWAFPGDLQVGNISPQYGAQVSDMDQTLFNAWAVASSPPVIGFDLTNKTTIDSVWDIITNNETLSVSQTWAGHPGRQIAYANYTVSYGDLQEYTNYNPMIHGTEAKLWGYEIWAKPQPTNTWAVLLMNNDAGSPHNITVQFKDIPWTGTANIRDIVNHKDFGTFTNSYTAVNVPRFGSAFLLFSH